MRNQYKIGILIAISLFSFTESSITHSDFSNRIYTNELSNGDSLLIINSMTGCFLGEKFELKIIMDKDLYYVSYIEHHHSKLLKIDKTFPLDFKKDLVSFELLTDPNLSLGIGSNCMMIFKLNDELPDTINKCPKEEFYYNLINRIKN